MSVRWLAEAWEHSPQEGGTLLVLLALADYANSEGECWPSIESLAHRARLSTRQVERALSVLVDAGELEKPRGPRTERRPYKLLTRQNVGTTPTSGATDTHVGSDPTPTSAPRVEPSGNRQLEPSATLPGTDNRQQLIAEYARIFDKPRITMSPSRMRAADRAFAEEPDFATLVRALEGAKVYYGRKGRVPEFTDIFGTFRGTGDLASRINWLVEQGGATQVAAGVSAIPVDVPSGQREMVRERQRHVEAWLRTPGDENLQARGERAAAWLRETLHVVAEAVQEVGGGVQIIWSRDAG